MAGRCMCSMSATRSANWSNKRTNHRVTENTEKDTDKTGEKEEDRHAGFPFSVWFCVFLCVLCDSVVSPLLPHRTFREINGGQPYDRVQPSPLRRASPGTAGLAVHRPSQRSRSQTDRSG